MTKEDIDLFCALLAHELRRLADARQAMTGDVEPVITLATGAVVQQSTHDCLVWHQARGHRIWIADAIVHADPPLHEDAMFMLSSSHQDVAAMLAAQQSHG